LGEYLIVFDLIIIKNEKGSIKIEIKIKINIEKLAK
jgi:hypothetical protein